MLLARSGRWVGSEAVVAKSDTCARERTWDAGCAREIPDGGAFSKVGKTVIERVGVAAGAGMEGGNEVVVGGCARECMAKKKWLVLFLVAAGLVCAEICGDGLRCGGETVEKENA